MKEFNFYRLKVVKDKTVSYSALENTFDAGDFFMNLIGDCAEEILAVVGVNCQGEPICGFEVSHGDVTSSIVDPAAIFKRLLQFSNVTGFFVSHNHPSSNLVFSSQDISSSKSLKRAGSLLGIKLLDHILVTDSNYLSARAEGII